MGFPVGEAQTVFVIDSEKWMSQHPVGQRLETFPEGG